MPRPSSLKRMVIPAILAKTKADFVDKRQTLMGLSPLIHVDVMDGKFVPQKTWGDVKTIAALLGETTYEIHLMVMDPLSVIVNWMKVRGFQRAIVHVESPVAMTDIIQECRARCIDIVLAISPGTPITKLTPHLKNIDGVQVMGGHPGKSGQPMDPKTLATVRLIRKKAPRLPIAFDIGVNRSTIPALVKAGVTRLVSASAILEADDPAAEYRAFMRLTK